MRLLLDTHALLWFASERTKLPARLLITLEDQRTDIYFSCASIWELAIKISVGKLRLSLDIGRELVPKLVENQVMELPISYLHAARVASLPLHHRDPFDRLLVAQAELERMDIVSHDLQLDAYGIRRIW